MIRNDGWQGFINENKALLDRIHERINTPRQDGFPPYFPGEEDVMRFTAIAPDKVSGIVIGMDPYPSWTVSGGEIIPEATGRSFEVRSVTSWHQKFRQSSLRNILKAVYSEIEWDTGASLSTIRADLGAGNVSIPEPPELFNRLEARGVMFLNAALTVRPDEPGSHMDIWAPFMERLMLYLADSSPQAVWMLFGNNAQNLVMPILKGKHVDVVKTCHPRLTGFIKDRPFRGISKTIQECCCQEQDLFV